MSVGIPSILEKWRLNLLIKANSLVRLFINFWVDLHEKYRLPIYWMSIIKVIELLLHPLNTKQ